MTARITRPLGEPSLGRSPHFRQLPCSRPDRASTLRSMTAARPPFALVAVAALALTACAGRAAEGAAPVASPTVAQAAGSVTPSADPAPTVPTTATTALPPVDAVVGLMGIQRGVNECLTLPTRCDTSTLAVDGSQAKRLLDDLVHYYLSNRLVARIVPALTYVVPERVHHFGRNSVEITLCEVDGSWQMDSRRTLRTDDDIVWNDLLVSRRARHVLRFEGGRWRRVEVTELEFWPGENRCPRPVTV